MNQSQIMNRNQKKISIGLNNNIQTAIRGSLSGSENENVRLVPVEIWALSLKKQLNDFRQTVPQLMKHIDNKKVITNKDFQFLNKIIGDYQKNYSTFEALARQKTVYSKHKMDTLQMFDSITSNSLNLKQNENKSLSSDFIDKLSLSEASSMSNLFVRKYLRGCHLKPSCLSSPPNIFSSQFIDEQANFLSHLEMFQNKLLKENREFIFERISLAKYGPHNILIELKYYNSSIVQPNTRKYSDSIFLLKAVINIQNGCLKDIMFGEPRETLYDEEGLVPSNFRFYQKITRNIRNFIFSSNLQQIRSLQEFNNFNQYVQKYTKCFFFKCIFCRKHLRHFEPPTRVIANAENIQYSTFDVCHEFCFKYG